MSFRVLFFDAANETPLGTAAVDIVPSIGDTVSIFTSTGVTWVEVTARNWSVDNLDDPPQDRDALHAPHIVRISAKRLKP